MSRPNFKNTELKFKKQTKSYNDWKTEFEKSLGKSKDDFIFQTMEQIPVSPIYTSEDTKNFEHLEYMSGSSSVFTRTI